MKPDQNYFLLGSEDPIRVRRPGVRKPPARRRTSGDRTTEVDYYTTLLIEHLQEHYPGEMLLLKDMRARARIAYKESVRADVPIADALANALRYLFFGFETSGFERLKSELWMQGYYSQAKGRHIELPEVALQIFAGELSLQCRTFLAQYPTTKDREALIARYGIREIVGEYLKRRWGL